MEDLPEPRPSVESPKKHLEKRQVQRPQKLKEEKEKEDPEAGEGDAAGGRDNAKAAREVEQSVRVRAADMPLALQKRAFRCAREALAAMPKLDSKRLALVLKKSSAAKLGASSPLPYLSLSMSDDKILRGVNFASGGAGILNETGLYFVQKLSFDDQIDCFEKTAVAITHKIGKLSSQKLLNDDALYFIGLGSNDYINNFLQPVLADGYIFSEQEFVQLLMTTVEDQLKRLYELGARKVVFDGLGPLGCIPSQRAKSDDGQCLEYVNQNALHFNSRLKNLLAQLNMKLQGAKMSVSDSYSIVLDLINNPKKYGFKVSHEPCCNVDTGVGGLCLPNSNLCPNRKDYVFWDAYHPTDAANQVIVDILFADQDSTHHQSPPPPATPGFRRTAAPSPAPSPF